MESILVMPGDQAESAFIHELLAKIGAKYSDLNMEELEGLTLGMMIQEGKDNDKVVSEQEQFEKIRK